MNNKKFPFQLLSSLEVQANSSTIKLKKEKDNNYLIEYILDGAGFIECENQKFYCKKDSIYLCHPDKTYTYYHDPEQPWRKIFALFTGEFAKSMIDSYNLNDKIYFPTQTKCLPYFKELLRIRYNSHATASVIIHHIFDLMAERKQFVENIPPEIHALKIIIEDHLHRKFILNDFAKAQNVSSAFLISGFRKHYQCTPYEYLLKCRLDSAVNMLKYTHLSIKEIAVMLNFNDQYYFSNLFKQKLGMSPKKYRETQ